MENEINIECLPSEFTGKGEVSGFRFNKIDESDSHYIYEVNTGTSIHYEVIKRLITEKMVSIENRVYSETDFKEYYPKSNGFGRTAWSTTSLSRAREIFNNKTSITTV